MWIALLERHLERVRRLRTLERETLSTFIHKEIAIYPYSTNLKWLKCRHPLKKLKTLDELE